MSKQEKEQENRFKEGILLFITKKKKKKIEIPIPLGSTIFYNSNSIKSNYYFWQIFNYLIYLFDV